MGLVRQLIMKWIELQRGSHTYYWPLIHSCMHSFSMHKTTIQAVNNLWLTKFSWFNNQ